MAPGFTTISDKKYIRLLKAESFLDCLKACGVDNWDGYGDAWELYYQQHPEEADE